LGILVSGCPRGIWKEKPQSQHDKHNKQQPSFIDRFPCPNSISHYLEDRFPCPNSISHYLNVDNFDIVNQVGFCQTSTPHKEINLSQLVKHFPWLQIHLWRKVVCFFSFICHVETSQTTIPLCCTLGTVGRLSMNRGASGCFHDTITYSAEVIEYWKLFFI